MIKEYMDQQAEKMVEAHQKHNAKEMYRITKNIASKARTKSVNINDKKQKFQKKRKRIRSKEYF